MADQEVLAAYGLDGYPFAVVVLALFVIVLFRAQGTYWVGRGVAAGVLRSSIGERLQGPGMTRAIAILHKWGLIAITLSFLTVGFQTMINAGAGLIRTPWHRYTIAMIPGCLAWAFIYATIGLAAFVAIVAAASGSPWGIAVIAALVLAAALAIIAHRRRRERRPSGSAEFAASGDSPANLP